MNEVLKNFFENNGRIGLEIILKKIINKYNMEKNDADVLLDIIKDYKILWNKFYTGVKNESKRTY